MRKTVGIKDWHDKRYPDTAPKKSTISEWFSEFKYDQNDDAPHSGRP